MDRDKWLGFRVAHYRRTLDWTQTQLAAEVGVSQTTIARIEAGQGVSKRALLGAIAEALRVPVSDLTQAGHRNSVREDEPVHLVIPHIRAALDGVDEPEPRDADQLAHDVQTLQVSRMGCDYRTLAQLLPRLLTDTAGEVCRSDPRRADLHVKVLVAAAIALRPLGYLDLAIRLAERAQATARSCEDPVLMAAADYTAAQASLAGGLPTQQRRSMQLASVAAERIGSCTGDDAAVWYGMCHLQAALSAAAQDRPDDARSHLAEAAAAAHGRPTDRWVQEFHPANVATWELAIALELRDVGAALAASSSVDRAQLRTKQRLARFHGDAARAYHAAGRSDRAITSMLTALDISGTDVRSRAVLRTMTASMVTSRYRDPRLHTLMRRMRIDPLALDTA